jgi:hypothetical protein
MPSSMAQDLYLEAARENTLMSLRDKIELFERGVTAQQIVRRSLFSLLQC